MNRRVIHGKQIFPKTSSGPRTVCAWDRHNWAGLIRLAARGRLPAIPPGGGSFAGAAAVADAVIAAADRAMIGENYLLGGPEASFQELIRRAGDILGRRLTDRVAPPRLLMAVAQTLGLVSRLTGLRPTITPDAARHARHEPFRVRDC